jgi:hypothetical protein
MDTYFLSLAGLSVIVISGLVYIEIEKVLAKRKHR